MDIFLTDVYHNKSTNEYLIKINVCTQLIWIYHLRKKKLVKRFPLHTYTHIWKLSLLFINWVNLLSTNQTIIKDLFDLFVSNKKYNKIHIKWNNNNKIFQVLNLCAFYFISQKIIMSYFKSFFFYVHYIWSKIKINCVGFLCW